MDFFSFDSIIFVHVYKVRYVFKFNFNFYLSSFYFCIIYKLRQCFECILDLDLIFALNATFFCEIMDDERFFYMDFFTMEDEMTMIIIPELEKGFSSPMIVAPQLMQFSIVKWCHKKETNVERR